MMKWTLQKRAWLGYTIASLLFIFIGCLFYNNMTMTMTSVAEQRQSHFLIVAIEHLLTHLKDAETGQRGYVLTGDENYLTPYNAGRMAVQQDLHRLRVLTQGKPLQKQRILAVEPLSQQKLSELKKTVDLRRTQGFEPARQLVRTNQGKKAMDNIRQLAQQMEKDETALYLQRAQNITQNFRWTLISSYIAGFLAIGLLGFVAVWLFREMSIRQAMNERLEVEIQERNKGEIQIQKLNTMLSKQVFNLEALNKELEAFAYSVSHDLRAPLRSIDGFSKMLLTKTQEKLTSDEQHYLTNICENAQRMGELIDDLLKLSRLSRAEMQHTEVNLSKLAQDILGGYQTQEPERQIDIKIMDGLVVNGDSSLLKVFMENLLSNAWKFTRKTPQAAIEVGITQKEEKPVYYIRDNGAGFNMKFVDKLFGVFQRLHQMEEFPGTGIGLATVQRVILRHGGRIWAEGAMNQGATFYFSFNP